VTDLFIGNSLIEQGINTAVFDRARPGARSFNAAFMATFPVEHVILFKRAQRLAPARVYYGFADAQLTQRPVDDWRLLSGAAARFDYLDPDTATTYRTELSTRLLLRLGGVLPLVADRFSLWGAVEKRRRQLAAIGMPVEGTNRLGRVRDFAQLEPVSPGQFRASLLATVSDRSGLSAPVADLLAIARHAGERVVVLQMPMPQAHRQKFNAGAEWGAYRAYVRELLEAAGAEFVDASDWAEDPDFIDVLHLSQAGAVGFTRRVAAMAVR
jgi:hypothetical protein